MSWDIYVMDFPQDALKIEDIASDFVPELLGAKSDLIAKIKEVVPTVDFTDPSRGQIRNPEFSIEISLGKEDVVESFAFHVRGGPAAIEMVAAILERLGLRAYDPSSENGFFDQENAARSVEEWRASRSCSPSLRTMLLKSTTSNSCS